MLKKHMVRLLKLALCAALINALVPTVSYVLASSSGKHVVEICTSFGLKKVVLQTGQETPASEHSPEIRCQFCLASQDAAAFITPDTVHISAAGIDAVLAARPLDPPVSARPWPDGRPRAPPASPV